MEKNDKDTILVTVELILLGIGIATGLYFLFKYLNSNPVQTYTSQPQFQQKTPKLKFVSEPILSEIKQEIIEEKPVGEVTDDRIFVTDAITELYDYTRHGMPWTSVTVSNRGPGEVYVAVNHMRDPRAPLPTGESINIDFKKRHSIKRLFLQCPEGQNATVDMHIVI